MLCQLVFIIYFSTFITILYPNLQTEIIEKNNGLDRARMIILKLPYVAYMKMQSSRSFSW